MDDASSGAWPRSRAAAPCRSGWWATPPPCSPSCCAAAWRSTSSPTRPRRTTRCSYLPEGVDPDDWHDYAEAKPEEFTDRARASMAKHVEAMVGFLDAGAEVFDYGNSIRDEARQGGYDRAFAFPGFVPAYIRPLFCEGKGPFRWAALSGDPKDIAATDRAVLDLFPDNDHLQRWIRAAQDKVAFQGLPARICWLGYGERDVAGLRFNEMVASGEISAPIVIGRDHLDSGSVASPYRETEAMADGSDAIADWPLLNALVNTVVRGDLGVDPPRRRRRHRPLDPRRPGQRRRRHAAGRAEARAGAAQRPGHGRDPARRRRLRPAPRRSPRSAASGSRWRRAMTLRRHVGRPRAGRPGPAPPAATAGSPGRRRTPSCASGSAARRAARGLEVDARPRRQPLGLGGDPDADGPVWCSAATSTRCRTAARSTGRSASCRPSRRSTCCATGALASAGRSGSPASPTRRAPGSASPAPARGCSPARWTPDRARALTDDDGHDDGRGDGGRRASTRTRSAGTTRRCAGSARSSNCTSSRAAALVERRRRSGVASAIWPHGRWRLDLRGRGRPRGHHPAGRPATTRCSRSPPRSLARPRPRPSGTARWRRSARCGSDPNGVNAIPSEVTAWLDARGPTRTTSGAWSREVGRAAAGTDAGRGVVDGRRPTSTPGLRDRLAARRSARRTRAAAPGRGTTPGILSAAGIPTAMLFVRNPTGVSHSPAEHAEPADCLAGVDALARVLSRRSRDERSGASTPGSATGPAAGVRVAGRRRRPDHRRRGRTDAAPGDDRLRRPGAARASRTRTRTPSTGRCAGARTTAAARSGPGGERMYAVAARLDPDSYLRAGPGHLRRDGAGRHHLRRRVPLPAPPGRRAAATPTRTRCRRRSSRPRPTPACG